MEQGDDAYEILGVPKTATPSDIKKAYRKLALENHPDKQTNQKDRDRAQHVFAKIAGAYEILSDEETKRQYDRSQRSQKRETGMPQGFDSSRCNVQFNDPYEVFKRSFEEQFGIEYPGAKFDYIEKPKAPAVEGDRDWSTNRRLITSSTTDPKNPTATKNQKSNEDVDESKSSTTKPKRRGSRFMKKVVDANSDGSSRNSSDPDDDDDTNHDNTTKSEAFVPRSPQKTKGRRKSDGGGILSIFRGKSKKQPESDTAGQELVEASNENKPPEVESRALVEGCNRDPNDNRPISMETTTKQIKHCDGTIETITETKIKRPDGSTETLRTSDKASKRPGWQKANKNKSLENGSESKQSKKLLTAGPIAAAKIKQNNTPDKSNEKSPTTKVGAKKKSSVKDPVNTAPRQLTLTNGTNTVITSEKASPSKTKRKMLTMGDDDKFTKDVKSSTKGTTSRALVKVGDNGDGNKKVTAKGSRALVPFSK